ncbi:MAG: hypothetical protein GX889_05040 [Clostridiales bacterium]|nr:hypothetical protein [Clostridiales bacterium]
MKFFNKKKKEKVYLKYHNDKVLEFDTEDELLKFQEEHEETLNDNKVVNNHNYNLNENKENSHLLSSIKNNKLSKHLLTIGLLMIFLSTFFVFIKFSEVKNPFSYLKITFSLKDFNNINNQEKKEEEEEKIENISEKDIKQEDKVVEEEKEIVNIQDKIQEEITNAANTGLVEIVEVLNKDIRNNYKYLKIDILNFYNDKNTLYTTKKNLEYRKLLAINKYKILTQNEYLFKKYEKMDVYNDLKERYSIYVNGVNEMISDMNRTALINKFNDLLKIDNSYVEKLKSENLLN